MITKNQYWWQGWNKHEKKQGLNFQYKNVCPSMGFPYRLDCLMFMMKIPLLVRWHLYIEMWSQYRACSLCRSKDCGVIKFHCLFGNTFLLCIVDFSTNIVIFLASCLDNTYPVQVIVGGVEFTLEAILCGQKAVLTHFLPLAHWNGCEYRLCFWCNHCILCMVNIILLV